MPLLAVPLLAEYIIPGNVVAVALGRSLQTAPGKGGLPSSSGWVIPTSPQQESRVRLSRVKNLTHISRFFGRALGEDDLTA